MTQASEVLQRLYATIVSRKGTPPDQSYTASLFAGGPTLICEKVMEEAGEAVVEGLKGDGPALTRESADVLYHLMVLWAEHGVTPEDVYGELQKREGVSGHVEKASRDK
ncbi:MAG: phosphoribosyl-ATP diphosphatase [Rhodospirillales bacterium]|jgi:phosphoribosyl-ATP pyrophosphohydrolase|nr:phosphoribosyl-ATP diphosphatase [Rhodospirillales bacterium]MBT4005606.1 phosphoribosyl-ATP diphosphatase [Rhodospirillales bacterium]MBT5076082.1 phosphoribosyl-ATP diphosphatase [Rhodospirillales bacterium]MBT5112325.1 phosphoribosyl-ATP diphosphatase [Rhodospirillales bacterium]MBT5672026.1 phosphoribosyl-ATP diphosphatase [Rhodospirillales bacterium]